tara:strand:+ start:1440 stop:1682 length:243 start_codon:yes stop_codon:yes gene_type:complete
MESIAVFIIYAVINFGDVILTQEFKPIQFKDKEKCIAYLNLNAEAINMSLIDHFETLGRPNSTVLEVGCLDRTRFVWEET